MWWNNKKYICNSGIGKRNDQFGQNKTWMISVLLVYRISRNRNKGAYQNGINNVCPEYYSAVM